MGWLLDRRPKTFELPCRRLHPGWPAYKAERFRLTGTQARLWRAPTNTCLRTIDHGDGRFGPSKPSLAGHVVLKPGTHLWWVGAAYQPWGYGNFIAGEFVLQVLDGKHRGRCVFSVIEDLHASSSEPGAGLEAVPEDEAGRFLEAQGLRGQWWM